MTIRINHILVRVLSAPLHVGHRLSEMRPHYQRRSPRCTHDLHSAGTPDQNCNTNDWYDQTTSRMARHLTCFHGRCTIMLSPFPPSPYPPLLPSAPTSPVSSVTGHGHWVRTPPLNHGRAAATPTISARQRRICLTSYRLLPPPCTTATSHLSFHPHNTLAFNHC